MTSLAAKSLPDLFRALPGLAAYVVALTLLLVKMQAVAMWTGRTLMRVSGSPNPEDHRDGQAPAVEHPDIARCRRAHRNDLENIPTFLVLGLVAVLVGVPVVGLWICFGVFVVARIAHSVFYLSAVQPWRSRSYGIGLLATLSLVVLVLVRVL